MFFFGDIRLVGKELDIDGVVDYSGRTLSRASKLGIHLCVLGSGRARAISDGDDENRCREEFINVCNKIGDVAKEYDITILIEPLNKNETNMINTVADGAEFVRNLNHPNVKLLADTYHMAIENESLDSICDNIDIIRHIHIANPDGRIFPDESDAYDYSAVCDVLKKCEYNSRISIEAGSKADFKEGAVKSLGFLKKYFPEFNTKSRAVKSTGLNA